MKFILISFVLIIGSFSSNNLTNDYSYKTTDFSYEDSSGNIINLSDYRGSYVYIDLWATWCGPCLAQQPYLEKLVYACKDKNITFISISLDDEKDKEQWKLKIKDKSMGIQLFEGQNGASDFVHSLQVAFIPRFVIINPNGEIIYNDAPPPSSPKLKRLFKKIGIL